MREGKKGKPLTTRHRQNQRLYSTLKGDLVPVWSRSNFYWRVRHSGDHSPRSPEVPSSAEAGISGLWSLTSPCVLCSPVLGSRRPWLVTEGTISLLSSVGGLASIHQPALREAIPHLLSPLPPLRKWKREGKPYV